MKHPIKLHNKNILNRAIRVYLNNYSAKSLPFTKHCAVPFKPSTPKSTHIPGILLHSPIEIEAKTFFIPSSVKATTIKHIPSIHPIDFSHSSSISVTKKKLDTNLKTNTKSDPRHKGGRNHLLPIIQYTLKNIPLRQITTIHKVPKKYNTGSYCTKSLQTPADMEFPSSPTNKPRGNGALLEQLNVCKVDGNINTRNEDNKRIYLNSIKNELWSFKTQRNCELGNYSTYRRKSEPILGYWPSTISNNSDIWKKHRETFSSALRI